MISYSSLNDEIFQKDEMLIITEKQAKLKCLNLKPSTLTHRHHHLLISPAANNSWNTAEKAITTPPPLPPAQMNHSSFEQCRDKLGAQTFANINESYDDDHDKGRELARCYDNLYLCGPFYVDTVDTYQ